MNHCRRYIAQSASVLLILCFTFVLYLAIPSYADANEQKLPDGLTLLKRVDEIRAPAQPWAFSLKVTEFSNDKQRSETDFRIYVRASASDVYRSLVLWTGPPTERGKVMLLDGNVYWLYTPGTRNSIRISPAQRLAGMASSADIASVNYQRDYNVDAVSNESIDGEACYKLSMLAKTDDVAYHAIELYVNQANNRPISAKYYALSGRLLKSASFGDFRMALGEQRPHLIRIFDAIDTHHSTNMAYSGMALEEKPASAFRREYLPYVKE